MQKKTVFECFFLEAKFFSRKKKNMFFFFFNTSVFFRITSLPVIEEIFATVPEEQIPIAAQLLDVQP